MAMLDERLYGILVDSFGKILLPGLMVTIPLTAISFTLALVLAVIAALVQLYVVFYELPRLGIVITPFSSAVIVFSVNEGAYAAEIIRAALVSVPSGQLAWREPGHHGFIMMRMIVWLVMTQRSVN